jgi:hypothetical protein
LIKIGGHTVKLVFPAGDGIKQNPGGAPGFFIKLGGKKTDVIVGVKILVQQDISYGPILRPIRAQILGVIQRYESLV